MNKNLNKVLKMSCAALCLFLVLGTNIVKLSAETKTPEDIAQDFQELTDAVNSLSEESTSEDVQEVQKLLEGMDFETQEEGNGLTGSMVGEAENSNQSIQLMFAQLQMQLAQTTKGQAMEYIEKIQAIQADQEKCTDYINQAQDLQQQAKESGSSEMPSDMKAYFEEKGLSYDKTGKDDLHNADEWNLNIQSLRNYQEQLSNDTQTLMVYVQDFMGQYNSYTQGASSAVADANELLTSIARGQTMLGGNSTGLMVTVGLGGIVVGVVGTLLVVRLQNKKKQ